MKVLPNILQVTLLVLLSTVIHNVNADVSVEYTEDGVLRKDGNCDITFTNFGIGDNIVKSVVIEDGSILITRLSNGNLGLNPNTAFTIEDYQTNIIITKNGNALTDFEVSNVKDGYFDLKINNVSVCDGLIIKLKFKDEQLELDNRIFYKAKHPTSAKENGTWGPNNKNGFSVPHIHWKINEGLDEIRKSCGIYLKYDKYESKHWHYTVNTDEGTNINTKKCTVLQFSEIVKKYITDIETLKELVGENFDVYVVKREGHNTAQTNGIITDTNYIIEYYQNEFSNKNKKILGTIRSSSPTIFTDFARIFIEKLGITSEVTWTIKGNTEVIGTIENQQVLHLTTDFGKFPGSTDGKFNYNKYFSNENAFYAARVYLDSITCEQNLFVMDDSYNCLPCNSKVGFYLSDDGKCINEVSLGFTDEGVVRRDGQCDITFVNLGVEHLKKSNVIKIADDNTNVFSITINDLINGNIGINKNTNITEADLHKHIIISQNGNAISDYEVKNVNYTTGYFDLKINNLSTCDGLIIKQTFQEQLLLVANRLYYYNIIPQKINTQFQTDHFGPSLKYPFKRIHWKFNEGLDDLRKTCGIYLVYGQNQLYLHEQNSNHWWYYLSIDSVNKKGCDVLQFFEVIKRNYIDYQYTIDLMGEDYIGYVLKREGHEEAHMDGVNLNVQNSIEIYQKSCKAQYPDQISCTIKSNEDLSFDQFTQRLLTECLNNKNQARKWEINDGVAQGTFDNQILKIFLPKDNKKGSLPDDVDVNIVYETMKKNGADLEHFTKVTRLVISSQCLDGSYMNEECICKNCPFNCESCDGPLYCKKCKDEEKCTLEDGLCMCKAGELEEADAAPIICDDDCSECDINRCTVCKDGNKEPRNGICVCKATYFENDKHQCEPCKKECGSCNNKNSCTSCKDVIAELSDGTCICRNSFLEENGMCHVCNNRCGRCNENGCIICDDFKTSPDENGNCN